MENHLIDNKDFQETKIQNLSIIEYDSTESIDTNYLKSKENDNNEINYSYFNNDKIMANFEKENGIYIQKIKSLEKLIFEYYEKKGSYFKNNLNRHQMDLNINSSENEKFTNHIKFDENILYTIKVDEDKENYLNLIMNNQESPDIPLSKKDIEENFFYYSNKVLNFFINELVYF